MAGDFARFEPAYGTTLEGNSICAIRLGNSSAPKAVMINGGLHAREWISPASMLGVIKELLTVRPHRPFALLVSRAAAPQVRG